MLCNGEGNGEQNSKRYHCCCCFSSVQCSSVATARSHAQRIESSELFSIANVPLSHYCHCSGCFCCRLFLSGGGGGDDSALQPWAPLSAAADECAGGERNCLCVCLLLLQQQQRCTDVLWVPVCACLTVCAMHSVSEYHQLWLRGGFCVSRSLLSLSPPFPTRAVLFCVCTVVTRDPAVADGNRRSLMKSLGAAAAAAAIW